MAEATETALACIREEVERAFSSAPGAMAYLPLLDSALRVYRDGKTFTATGMAAYEHFEAGK